MAPNDARLTIDVEGVRKFVEVGFLEQAPGVKSAARLCALIGGISLSILTLAIAFSIVWVSIKADDRQGMAAIYGVLTGVIGALSAGVWASLRERTETGPEQEHAVTEVTT